MSNPIMGGCPYQVPDGFNDRNRFPPDHMFIGEIENGKRYPLACYTKEESDARYAEKGSLDRIEIDLARKAEQSQVDEIAAQVAGKANQSDFEALSETVSGKANQSEVTQLSQKLYEKADKENVRQDVANLQGQINQIEISATAESVVAPEVAAARVSSDGTEYPTLKEHLDATEGYLGSRIDDIDGVFTSGMNLLNPDTVKRNFLLNSSGVETPETNGFISDYIQVVAGQKYKIDRAIGSETFPTVCYYDANKDFVSASDGLSTSFVIPSGCAYVRTNGSLTYIDQSYFIPEYCTERFDFQKAIGGKNKISYQLWSENHIFYYDGALHSKSYIYLSNQDKIDFVLGTNVPVSGSGAYLFFDKSTGTLTASNNSGLMSNDVYFLAFLKYPSFDNEIKFTALTCAYPALTFDFIANKLYFDFKWYGYIFYNGQTYEIPRYYTQELDIPEFSLIVYNVETGSFESVLFDAVKYGKSKYIPICIRNYNDIVGNCNCYETKPYAKSYKTMLCYGDSLTWYDGHEFTWGPHTGEMCVGFESYVRQYLRLSVLNVGVSGQTTPQICARLVSDQSPLTAEYITIMGGDNDDRLGISAGTVLPPGSAFSTSTVAGALQHAIEVVLAGNPDARIILMTEPIGWTYRNGSMERVDDVYPQTYRNVAALYGLPLIDLWALSGINELNRDDWMIDPTVEAGNTSYIYHPYNNAWERIGKLIVKELEKY